MRLFRVLQCVVICVFSFTIDAKEKKSVVQPTIVLVDQSGLEAAPKEKEMSLSFIGLIEFEKEGKLHYCNATHLKMGFAISSESCLKKIETVSSITLVYFDKQGKQKIEKIPHPEIKKREQIPLTLSIPNAVDSGWNISGNEALPDDSWFGGFKPSWELVRLWGFSPLGNLKFQMQVNTCKAARKIPFVQRVKQLPEDAEEDILEEVPLFDKASPLAKNLILEDCIKPVDETVTGALISLAKTFDKKLGTLDFERFSPFQNRQLSALTIPEDRIFVRYIGADALDHPLPSDLSSFRVLFANPF